ncbi:MAG: hypothetical protein ABFR62_07185 [Bacteroidota bacterium]
MKTIRNTKKDKYFRIRKRDLNSNGEIFPHILLEQMENALTTPVKDIERNYNLSAKRSSSIYKVDIIGGANTGDELRIHTQLGKFDAKTAVYHIQVVKKDKRNKQSIVCKASFSYKLENNLAIQKIAS